MSNEKKANDKFSNNKGLEVKNIPNTIKIGQQQFLFHSKVLQMIETTHIDVRNVLQPLLENANEKEKILNLFS